MWVSLCLDLNSTMFPESCLESVDCDKLLTIFSPQENSLGWGRVKPVGLEAELPAPPRTPPCLPFPHYTPLPTRCP